MKELQETNPQSRAGIYLELDVSVCSFEVCKWKQSVDDFCVHLQRRQDWEDDY